VHLFPFLTKGNSTANQASQSEETLRIDFLQKFTVPVRAGINKSGSEYIDGVFAAGIFGPGTSVTGQRFSNGGTAMALMGPFFLTDSVSVTDSNTAQPFSFRPTTLLQFRDGITFGKGTEPGSTINVGKSCGNFAFSEE
jgi:hypothetical protein